MARETVPDRQCSIRKRFRTKRVRAHREWKYQKEILRYTNTLIIVIIIITHAVKNDEK